jgi:hypothetical protein
MYRHILTVTRNRLSFIELNDDQFLNVVRGLVAGSVRVLITTHAEKQMKKRQLSKNAGYACIGVWSHS